MPYKTLHMKKVTIIYCRQQLLQSCNVVSNTKDNKNKTNNNNNNRENLEARRRR